MSTGPEPASDSHPEPELPGLEATDLEQLCELLRVLEPVLDAADNAINRLLCDDFDELARDDASTKALLRASATSRRLRRQLWPVAVRAYNRSLKDS